MAERRTCRAAKGSAASAALSRIGDHCFSVFNCKNAIWAEVYATWFSSFGTTITLVREDYGKPGPIVSCHAHSTLGSGFLESVDYLLGFLFGGMCYGACWADVFASSAEDHASFWVLDHCFLFSIFFFEFEDTVVAEVHTFSTGYAFLVVYLWCPRYLVSGDAFECFSFQIVASLL